MPSKAKMETDVQRSSNTAATCTMGTPTLTGSGYYYVQSTCTFETPLSAEWTSYFTQSMQRLRYNVTVSGNTATGKTVTGKTVTGKTVTGKTVTGVGFSMSCGVFSGGQ